MAIPLRVEAGPNRRITQARATIRRVDIQAQSRSPKNRQATTIPPTKIRTRIPLLPKVPPLRIATSHRIRAQREPLPEPLRPIAMNRKHRVPKVLLPELPLRTATLRQSQVRREPPQEPLRPIAMNRKHRVPKVLLPELPPRAATHHRFQVPKVPRSDRPPSGTRTTILISMISIGTARIPECGHRVVGRQVPCGLRRLGRPSPVTVARARRPWPTTTGTT